MGIRLKKELIHTGKSQQQKGRRAEIELAGLLRERGYDVRPGKPLNFGQEADIVGLDGIHAEPKRRECVDLLAALAQAAKDAEFFGDGIPMVFHRGNRQKWRVTMELDHWLALYDRKKTEKNGGRYNVTRKAESPCSSSYKPYEKGGSGKGRYQ